MLGIGTASGKFGELLQGELPGGDGHFLVTLPISAVSLASFQYSETGNNKSVSPSDKIKSALLVKKIMAYFKLSSGWRLTLSSQLPVGKGLGSSTADLVACARAITMATGKHLPTDVFLQFLKEIEPSDGVMYDGVVCFYHRKVALHCLLGQPPNLMIVGFDEGGIIDTIEYNKKLNEYTHGEKAEYAILLDNLITACKEQNIKKIGAISTKSSILHQKINPKKNLDFFIEICGSIGAPGIIVAHSGTYIGIILDRNDHSFTDQLRFIQEKMRENSLQVELFTPFNKTTEITFGNEKNTRTGNV